MRMIYSLPILMLSLNIGLSVHAQERSEKDSTGLPGDNFSLQGALEMFKIADSPEAFEKLLNSEDNKVNNLDLNEDGNTDYMRVINKKDGDVNIFVLQAVVSETESQDIAVIELEKKDADYAIVQITGDEDIYGETTIVEPKAEAENAFNMPAGGQPHGPSAGYISADAAAGIIVNVWGWPCVRYVYAPAYVVWVSPWSWRRRPVWWHPWRPLSWHAYRPVHYRYYNRYAVVHTRRVVRAPVIYRPVRSTSVTVINRNRVVVNNYRATRPSQGNRMSAPRGGTPYGNRVSAPRGSAPRGSRVGSPGNTRPNGNRVGSPGNTRPNGNRVSPRGSTRPSGNRVSAPGNTRPGGSRAGTSSRSSRQYRTTTRSTNTVRERSGNTRTGSQQRKPARVKRER